MSTVVNCEQEGAESTSVGNRVPEPDECRGTSAVLARQAQDCTKLHGLDKKDTRAAQRS